MGDGLVPRVTCGGYNTQVSDTQGSAASFSARTAWARSLETPLRVFLRTQIGSAAVLLAATVAALVWANAGGSSYEAVWQTPLVIRIGDHGISQDLRGW